MKGINLAGGSGVRLHPMTHAIDELELIAASVKDGNYGAYLTDILEHG